MINHSNTFVIVLLALVKHQLHAFFHLPPPITNRSLTREQPFHKIMLFEGVETEDMEVNWNEGRHFGLMASEKLSQLYGGLTGGELTEVEKVDDAAVHFFPGQLRIQAVLDPVDPADEGDEEVVDVQLAVSLVVGECLCKQVEKGDAKQHVGALVGLTTLHQRNRIHVYLHQHQLFHSKAQRECRLLGSEWLTVPLYVCLKLHYGLNLCARLVDGLLHALLDVRIESELVLLFCHFEVKLLQLPIDLELSQVVQLGVLRKKEGVKFEQPPNSS